MKEFFKYIDANVFDQIKAQISAGQKLGIACSGGCDSVFLLLLAKELCGAENLIALHYNHAVREASKEDEVFVKELCKKLKIKCVAKKRESKLEKISEENLRNLRLNFFRNACKKEKIKVLLQGHIKDDVAETLLMRLMSGASLDGLCAPKPVSSLSLAEGKKLVLLRPLLHIEKAEIIKKLTSLKQAWREDESNAQNYFLRNKIRNIILPELKKLDSKNVLESFTRSRKLLEEDANLIDANFALHIKQIDNKFLLDDFALSQTALIRRAAQKLLVLQGLAMRSKAADDFVLQCAQKTSAKISFQTGDLIFNKKTKSIFFQKKQKEISYKIQLTLGENIVPNGNKIIVEKIEVDKALFGKICAGKFDEKMCVHISANPQTLIARTALSADAYRPMGAKSERKLSAMLSAKKVEKSLRKILPLICDASGKLVWMPSLAPAEDFKIKKLSDAIRLTYFDS